MSQRVDDKTLAKQIKLNQPLRGGPIEILLLLAEDLRDSRDAARKALAVLRKVEWRAKAYGDRCPDCFCAAPVHYSKCALAEAISDLEKVL